MSSFERCKSLNTIPAKKLADMVRAIESSDKDLQYKTTKLIALNRYAESNIPIEYWSLKMEKHFQGDKRLLDKYNEYVLDLKQTYISGTSVCLAGSHGLGKTMTATCILKKAVEKGFTTLYTTVSDMVNVLIQASHEDKFLARRELVLVDFLAIDEFDSRFFDQSTEAANMFGRTIEYVIRTRLQNKIPVIMITNSPNLIESFSGPIKQSLSSITSKIKLFPVLGEDFRKAK